jgi:hypothetical protein
MYNDEFDQFVFHDAVERCGLKARDARARVEHHSSWIHHALVRLGYAESPAERRAAQREIEQDIRNIEKRHGWDQQMLSAFRERQQAVPVSPAQLEPAGIPVTGESPDRCVFPS